MPAATLRYCTHLQSSCAIWAYAYHEKQAVRTYDKAQGTAMKYEYDFSDGERGKHYGKYWRERAEAAEARVQALEVALRLREAETWASAAEFVEDVAIELGCRASLLEEPEKV